MTADLFWQTTPPTSWPSPPRRFSISALHEAESCPRRWALRHATYGGIGEGYPSKLSLGAVRGRVIHAALERIAIALDRAHAASMSDVVTVLIALGGISAVLERELAVVTGEVGDTARGHKHLAHTMEQVRRQLPNMRLTVQSALQRALRFPAGAIVLQRALPGKESAPLESGFHTEVRLAPPDMDWVGIADVIRLTGNECEIIDYKSGEESRSHEEQLRLYALLWARDHRLNPFGRLADHLTLIYPDGVREVQPPTRHDLDQMEMELRDRVREARSGLEEAPPAARVTPENCRFCDVKHLCADYWTEAGQQCVQEATPPSIRSLQVLVLEQRSPSFGIGTIDLDAYLEAGSRVLLNHTPPPPLNAGGRARLMDVRVDRDAEGTAVVQSLPFSEVYIVDGRPGEAMV